MDDLSVRGSLMKILVAGLKATKNARKAHKKQTKKGKTTKLQRLHSMFSAGLVTLMGPTYRWGKPTREI